MEPARANGQPVIKIGRKGLRKFQFGDDGPVFECDVTRIYSQLAKIQEQFLDEKRIVAKIDEWNSSLVNFVSMLQGEGGQQVTLTEAREFWAIIQEEATQLANFYDLDARRKRFSPSPSEGSTASDSRPSSEIYSGTPSKESQPGRFCTVLEVEQES